MSDKNVQGSRLTFLQNSSAKYMIFWGAPAHLTGVLGKVNKAFPPLNCCMAGYVFSTVFRQ